jgi:hypothetical protein
MCQQYGQPACQQHRHWCLYAVTTPLPLTVGPRTTFNQNSKKYLFCWLCIIMYHNNVTNLIHTTCNQPTAKSARNSHQKLLKMDAWRPKHVEDYATIMCLWKWKCITFVTLLWSKKYLSHHYAWPPCWYLTHSPCQRQYWYISSLAMHVARQHHLTMTGQTVVFCWRVWRACRSQWLLACWEWGFESRRGQGCLSLVSCAFGQVDIAASGWSCASRSPTACCVSAPIMRPWPTRGCRVTGGGGMYRALNRSPTFG